jgi:hypothetical protein
MLNFCGIVVAILKMATGRNFSMLGINSGHHYLPTIIRKSMADVRYCRNELEVKIVISGPLMFASICME